MRRGTPCKAGSLLTWQEGARVRLCAQCPVRRASSRKEEQACGHPLQGDQPQNWRATGPRNGGRQPNNWTGRRYFLTPLAPTNSSWTSVVTCPRSPVEAVRWFSAWYACSDHCRLHLSFPPVLCPTLPEVCLREDRLLHLSLFSQSRTGDIYVYAATHSVFHSLSSLSHSSTDHYALPRVTGLSLAGLLHVEECVATTRLVLGVVFSWFCFAITSTLSWVPVLVVGEHSKTLELPPRRRHGT